MTPDILGGIVRAVLAAVGGILMSQGYVDTETWMAVSGAVVTLAVTLWSISAKRSVEIFRE